MKRIVLPMFVVAGAIFGLVFLWQASLWLFLDLYAFILVPCLGTLYALLAHGFSSGKSAFMLALRDDAGRAEYTEADRFFGLLGSSYIAFSILGSVISLIDMMRNLQDKTQLGPRLALSFISVEYAVILLLLIVLPYRNSIQKRLSALEPGSELPR